MTINVAELQMTTGLTRDEAITLRILMRSINIENPRIADVGSWKGFSCAILASEAQHCGGNVVAVDHWKGNSDTWNIPVAETEDICAIFKHNMEVLGYTDIVHILSMTSSQALKILQDASFSLVFLDADHRYTPVKEDIEGWWKKLQVGGILCGHDCEAYYPNLPEEARQLIDKHLENDYIEGIGCHPGVIRAVYDHFGDNFSLMGRIWHVKKGDISHDDIRGT